AVEDDAIVGVVAMQQDAGLQSATDGEFRRASWHMDFIYQIGGVSTAPGNPAAKSHNPPPGITDPPPPPPLSGQNPPRATRCASRLALLKAAGRPRPRQADHPLAEHGPLPRRARRDRPGRLP